MKKSELFKKALDMGFVVTSKTTVKELRELIKNYAPPEELKPLKIKGIPLKEGDIVESKVFQFKKINVSVNYKEKAGVGWLNFQDVGNTGHKMDLMEWDAKKVEEFFCES